MRSSSYAPVSWHKEMAACTHICLSAAGSRQHRAHNPRGDAVHRGRRVSLRAPESEVWKKERTMVR